MPARLHPIPPGGRSLPVGVCFSVCRRPLPVPKKRRHQQRRLPARRAPGRSSSTRQRDDRPARAGACRRRPAPPFGRGGAGACCTVGTGPAAAAVEACQICPQVRHPPGQGGPGRQSQRYSPWRARPAAAAGAAAAAAAAGCSPAPCASDHPDCVHARPVRCGVWRAWRGWCLGVGKLPSCVVLTWRNPGCQRPTHLRQKCKVTGGRLATENECKGVALTGLE
jgi:hypothetical protein